MRIIVCLILLVLSSGCKDKEPALPRLEEETFIDLLIDLHVAETYIVKVSPTLQDSMASLARTSIAGLYGLEVEDMEEQIRLLQANPELHRAVYNRVLAKMDSLRENQARNENSPFPVEGLDPNVN